MRRDRALVSVLVGVVAGSVPRADSNRATEVVEEDQVAVALHDRLQQCHHPGDVAHGSGDAATQALNEHRRASLDPDGVTPDDLKKLTLINLYNARSAWLANLHAALDHTVRVAYRWEGADPATIDEDAILARVLALNGERTTAVAVGPLVAGGGNGRV